MSKFVGRDGRKARFLSVSAMTAIALTTVSGTALAQEQASAPESSAATAPQANDESIVVTGSRIAKRDYESNSPIVTVSAEQLTSSSNVTLEATLEQMPQFAAGGDQFGGGRATLNLRNLGTNRNLVLLEGRRLQPSQADFAPDINSLPQSIIGGVEVISGGASAVYGSDALSGVINFKLRKNFTGVELTGRYGVAEEGDYQTYNVGGIVGGDFADGRGNAFFAADYTNRGAVFNRDRDFFANAYRAGLGQSYTFIGNGYYKPGFAPINQSELDAYFTSAASNYANGAVNAATATLGFNNTNLSIFNTSGANIYNYAGPPDLRYAVATTNGVKSVVYIPGAESYLSGPLERYSFFGKSNYKISDNVEVFGQGFYTTYKTTGVQPAGLLDNFWALRIPRDAAHPVPTSLDYLLESRGAPVGTYIGADGATHIRGSAAATPWTYGGSSSFAGPLVKESTNQVYQVLAGIKGDLGFHNIHWEVTAQHGTSSTLVSNVSGSVRYSRLQELIAAPFYGQNYVSPTAGRLVCTTGILPFGETNSSAAQPNPGAGSVTLGGRTFSRNISDDCLDYISGRAKENTTLDQDVVEGTVSGRLFKLPAGDVQFALGGTYRYNNYLFQTDSLYEPKADTSADIINDFGRRNTRGSTSVYEGFGELAIPLLRDLPFIESLDLDLAARYSDYEQAGGVWAYKADGSWTIVSGLQVRGGYQRAVRAPNVNELFGPQSTTFSFGVFDPCAANSPGPFGNNAGNPNRAQVQTLCRALIPTTVPYDPNTYVGAGGIPLLVGSQAGNPALKPEKADTFTAGVVFRPSWNLPLNSRVSLSIDYYNIKIEGAVAALTPAESYQLCFNANGASNPTYSASNPYCTPIVRDPISGFPVNVVNLNQNLGGLKTSGVDVQFDLTSSIGPGRLVINSVVSYLDSFQRQLNPTTSFVEYAGTTNGGSATYFRWRASTNVSYAIDPVTVGLRWRYYGSLKDATSIANPATTIKGLRSYNVVDLYGNAQINDHFELQAGIDNVLNVSPRSYGVLAGATQSGQTLPSYYDVLGRRYFIGAKVKF